MPKLKQEICLRPPQLAEPAGSAIRFGFIELRGRGMERQAETFPLISTFLS
jgi:hypothetical protein